MSDFLRILMVGDTVGNPGREAVEKLYPGIRKEHGIDMCVMNGENVAGGHGITPRLADQLFGLGIDCITMGDHVWDKKEIFDYLGKEKHIVRPCNYPAGVPGRGSALVTLLDGTQVGVVNVLGRVFMHVQAENPFASVKAHVEQLRQKTPIVLVDCHAEATSEKIAMLRFLDGQVSCLYGTHTHVQTADEQVTPRGTAYITDCGMTGPYDSVIGRVSEQVVTRFLTQMPKRMEVAQGDVRLCGILVDVHRQSGKAMKISRHQWKLN